MIRSHARRLARTLALVGAAALLATASPALADGWHHHHGYYGGYGWRGPGYRYGWHVRPRWGWGGGPVYAPPPIVTPYYGAPVYPYGYPYGYGGYGLYGRPGVQLYFGPHFGIGF
jgi:hypothetical protein